jgi:hypothetical protein
MYPTLVIRPGESIEVRIDGDILRCGITLLGDLVPCRPVVVAGSPGDPVELEIAPHDTNKPMTLAVMSNDFEFPDRRLILTVPPGGVPYVIGEGTARLTARR